MSVGSEEGREHTDPSRTLFASCAYPGIQSGSVGNLFFFILLPFLISQTLMRTGCIFAGSPCLVSTQSTAHPAGSSAEPAAAPSFSDILLSMHEISALDP